MDDTNQSLSKTVGELLLMDVFARHQVGKENRRTLSEEERAEIRRIVNDLKDQTEQFLKNNQTQTTTSSQASNLSVEHIEEERSL